MSSSSGLTRAEVEKLLPRNDNPSNEEQRLRQVAEREARFARANLARLPGEYAKSDSARQSDSTRPFDDTESPQPPQPPQPPLKRYPQEVSSRYEPDESPQPPMKRYPQEVSSRYNPDEQDEPDEALEKIIDLLQKFRQQYNCTKKAAGGRRRKTKRRRSASRRR
jgi:hypothetical protein